MIAVKGETPVQDLRGVWQGTPLPCRKGRGPNIRYPTLKPPSPDSMLSHPHPHHTLNWHGTSNVAQILCSHTKLSEKGAVVHPDLEVLYVTMVCEERERQAEHQRLMALAHRLRRQHRRTKTHSLIGLLRRRKTAALQPLEPQIAPEHPNSARTRRHRQSSQLRLQRRIRDECNRCRGL
jgi:hypothetical protein